MAPADFTRVWNAMRQDLPIEAIMEQIDNASNEAFKCHNTQDRNVTSHPHLLGAALAYHCHAAVVRRIAARITSNFIFSECLRDLTYRHCDREVVEGVLACIGLHEKDVDYNGWLAYALNHEQRAWFWSLTVAGRFLQHFYRKDAGIKQRVSRAVVGPPIAYMRKIRELLDLPENVE